MTWVGGHSDTAERYLWEIGAHCENPTRDLKKLGGVRLAIADGSPNPKSPNMMLIDLLPDFVTQKAINSTSNIIKQYQHEFDNFGFDHDWSIQSTDNYKKAIGVLRRIGGI